MTSKLTCTICKRVTDDKVHPFYQEYLQKCQDILKVRKQNHLKFEHVILPSKPNTTDGYHSQCYKMFTSIHHRYKCEGTENGEKSKSKSSAPEDAQIIVVTPDIKTESSPEDEGDLCTFTCVICDDIYSGKITLFTKETLKKCKEVLRRRRDGNLKNADIVLPSDVTATDGYHSNCFKSFVTLKRGCDNNVEVENGKSPAKKNKSTQESTSSASKGQISSPKGLINVCFFCDQERKRVKQMRVPLHTGQKSSLENILKKHATVSENPEYQKKFEKLETTFFYHKICMNNFYSKVMKLSTNTKNKTDWHVARNYHKVAYDKVCNFLRMNVVKKEHCYMLNDLTNYYKRCLKNLAAKNSASFDRRVTSQHLESKILKTLRKDIKIMVVYNEKIVTPKSWTVFDDSRMSNDFHENYDDVERVDDEFEDEDVDDDDDDDFDVEEIEDGDEDLDEDLNSH